MTDEAPTVLIVCKGACVLESGKPGTGFSFVGKDGALGREFALSRKSKIFPIAPKCGVIYRVENPEENSFVGPAKYEKPWPNETDVLGWRAKHDMTLGEEREASRRKAGENAARDKALIALDPIRRLYHTTDGLGRRLLIAAMIEYVQRNPAYDKDR